MHERGEGNRSLHNMDAFDSMFEWAETSFCSTAMRNYKPEPKPDTLDYVFEHVVCCSGNKSKNRKQHQRSLTLSFVHVKILLGIVHLQTGGKGARRGAHESDGARP